MSDILKDIDEAIARNSKRFDPFGGDAWDEDRVGHGSHADSMRVYAPRTGIEEEPDGRERAWAALVAPLFDRAVEAIVAAQDGSAPTDRVADAFRAEVRRQGLAPCEIEIDGRREWLTTATFTVDSQVEAFRQEEALWGEPEQLCTCPTVDVSTWAEMAEGRTTTMRGYDPGCPVCPDPYARPVDAALEPNPVDIRPDPRLHGHFDNDPYQCSPDCPMPAAPRPWWKRFWR